MAGFNTNGLPVIGPLVQNGVTQTGDNGLIPQLSGYEKTPVDTNYLNGQAAQPQVFPASLGAHAFDIAALYFAIAANTATATSGAATLSKPVGTITSETLSTAAGSNYTLTLTNTFITAASNIKAAVFTKSTNTGGGPVVIQSITPASGSVAIVMQNTGAAALAGTANLGIMFLASAAY